MTLQTRIVKILYLYFLINKKKSQIIKHKKGTYDVKRMSSAIEKVEYINKYGIGYQRVEAVSKIVLDFISKWE
jgi:hypothetical protein